MTDQATAATQPLLQTMSDALVANTLHGLLLLLDRIPDANLDLEIQSYRRAAKTQLQIAANWSAGKLRLSDTRELNEPLDRLRIQLREANRAQTYLADLRAQACKVFGALGEEERIDVLGRTSGEGLNPAQHLFEVLTDEEASVCVSALDHLTIQTEDGATDGA